MCIPSSRGWYISVVENEFLGDHVFRTTNNGREFGGSGCGINRDMVQRLRKTLVLVDK